MINRSLMVIREIYALAWSTALGQTPTETRVKKNAIPCLSILDLPFLHHTPPSLLSSYEVQHGQKSYFAMPSSWWDAESKSGVGSLGMIGAAGIYLRCLSSARDLLGRLFLCPPPHSNSPFISPLPGALTRESVGLAPSVSLWCLTSPGKLLSGPMFGYTLSSNLTALSLYELDDTAESRGSRSLDFGKVIVPTRLFCGCGFSPWGLNSYALDFFISIGTRSSELRDTWVGASLYEVKLPRWLLEDE